MGQNPGITVATWRAVNLASDSANSIHDDRTAAAMGFRGGFVGGVTLLGQAFDAWLAEASGASRLPAHVDFTLDGPTYEGETITIQADSGEERWNFSITGEAGTRTSHGAITRVTSGGVVATVERDAIEIAQLVDLRPDVLTTTRTFTQDEVRDYRSRTADTNSARQHVAEIAPTGMWTNPMTPVIAVLTPDILTMHRSSSIDIQSLPVVGTPYVFTRSIVSARMNRESGKGFVIVSCVVRTLDGDGIVANIRHKSVARMRDLASSV